MARSTIVQGPPFDPLAWNVSGDTEMLRVRILHTRSLIRIGGTGTWDYCPAAGGPCYSSAKALHVRRTSSGFNIAGHAIRGGLWIRPQSDVNYLSVDGRSYRGKIRLIGTRKGYADVVNYVDMEDYLLGVLPREVGSAWPIEALKSQAVISRTFALANKTTDSAQIYDVLNDVRSQMYGGRSDEAMAPTRAVLETKGQILISPDGKPIQAFFHSSCGGMTEKPSAVWATTSPDDAFGCTADSFCSDDPFRTWHLTMAVSSLRARLNRAGIRVGMLKDIQITEKSASGRAEKLTLLWRGGSKVVSGNRFRLALGPETLRSTLLTDIHRTAGRFYFEGHGWGHGVGLCQWGARGRATAGQTYDYILKVYYPGATLLKPTEPSVTNPVLPSTSSVNGL